MDAWNKNSGLIMATLAGSRLYGTNRPESDVDIRGVCFPPREALLGMQGFEQFQPKGSNAVQWSKDNGFSESDDVTIYSINKFFSLCLNANPNIIELLFAPRSTRLYISASWIQVLDHRDIFLSTKVVHTFSGYAYSQLSRIQRHYKWLNDPPEKPDPYDFGMEDTGEGAHRWTVPSLKSAYENRIKEHRHYQEWRKNRNPARAKLEAAYGYDTKHAAHLYRLIDEATELLTTGHLTLPLKKEYRDRYCTVLNGCTTYENVVEMGKTSKEQLQVLEKVSPLPVHPNHSAAEELLIELQWEWLKR